MARVKGSLGVEYYMKKCKGKIREGKVPVKELSKGEWKKYDTRKMQAKIEKMRMKRLIDLGRLMKIACKTTCWMRFLKANMKERQPGFYETEYMRLNRIRKEVVRIYREEFGGSEMDRYPELIEPVDKEIDEEGWITLHFN